MCSDGPILRLSAVAVQTQPDRLLFIPVGLGLGRDLGPIVLERHHPVKDGMTWL